MKLMEKEQVELTDGQLTMPLKIIVLIYTAHFTELLPLFYEKDDTAVRNLKTIWNNRFGHVHFSWQVLLLRAEKNLS